MSATIAHEIRDRWSGGVQFTAQIQCPSDAPLGAKVGLAVKWAIKARANLADADLARADLVIDAGTPNGYRCVGWLRDGWLSVRAGCRDMRLTEGRAYWAGKPERDEVLAALDYVEAVARLRGWALEAPAKSEAA